MNCEVCLEEKRESVPLVLRTFDVDKEEIEERLKGLKYELRVSPAGVDVKFFREEDFIEGKGKLRGLYYSEGSRPLEEVVGNLLKNLGYSLAVAESCSGGLLSARIVNVPGSSSYFLGGLVVYSNDLKRELLGVKEETLKRFGAVSRETCREMLEGIRRRLGADCAVAITGIAGPGGTETKPEGLTFVGVSVRDREVVERRVFKGGRNVNRFMSTQLALKILKDLLEGERYDPSNSHTGRERGAC